MPPMVVPSWSMLVRRASLTLALLALLQAILPGWHRLEHLAPLASAPAAHDCGHQHDHDGADAPAGEDGPEDDHHGCQLCLALQAGSHADLASPPMPPAPTATDGSAAGAPAARPFSQGPPRWTPPARGPPRRT